MNNNPLSYVPNAEFMLFTGYSPSQLEIIRERIVGFAEHLESHGFQVESIEDRPLSEDFMLNGVPKDFAKLETQGLIICHYTGVLKNVAPDSEASLVSRNIYSTSLPIRRDLIAHTNTQMFFATAHTVDAAKGTIAINVYIPQQERNIDEPQPKAKDDFVIDL